MLTIAAILVIASLGISAWFYPAVWVSIAVCILPALIIAMIHGERINIFSGRKLGVMTATKGNSLALVGAFFIPGRITEILKPFYFFKTRKMPISTGISIVVVERIFDVVALVTLTLVAINFIDIPSQNFSETIANLTISVSVLLLLVVLTAFQFPKVIEQLIKWLPAASLRQFLEASFVSFREGLAFGFSYWSIILTATVWAGSVGLYWLFLQFDGGVQLGISQSLLVFLIGTLGITITITPGGIGTFEAAITLILQQFGYSFEVALASAIGLRMIIFIPNAIIAGYVILFEGFSFVKMRKLAAEIGADDERSK
jgi:uncharacterized protein (TIRG00374 family)